MKGFTYIQEQQDSKSAKAANDTRFFFFVF